MHVSLLRRCRLFPCMFFNSNKFKNSFITASYRCLASCQISLILNPCTVRKQCVLAMEQADPTTVTDSTQSTITEVSDDKISECGKRKSEEPLENEGRGRGKRRRGERGKKQRPGERYIPPPQKRNPGVSFSQEHFDETSYYFEGGLRKVVPYYYDFKTYCKGRWIGKSLLEVFQSEFRSESIDYYQRAAKEGRIRLNQSPVEDLSIILRNNDHMCNTVHRHEPPVVGRPLEILVDDGEVLVVDKPASIPVHPCGRFRHNTVIFILGKERGVAELHTVHRLDRLTSGVLLFARDLDTSKRLDQLVRDRQLVKEYVCRVEGEFPESEVTCEEPILVVSFKIGLCRVHPNGKDCRTVFQRLSYNGQSSVVRCLPLTGRTHQIRVHLQYLGHPILNDPIYGSSAWGPHRGKGGQVDQTDEEVIKALVEEHRAKESLHMLDIPDGEIEAISKSKQGKGTSGDSQCTELCKDDSKSDAAMAESSGGKTTSECAKEFEHLSKSKTCNKTSTCCDTTSDTVASSNFSNNAQNTQNDANLTSEFAKEIEDLSKSKTFEEKDASGDSQQSTSCDANVASSNFSSKAQNDNTQNDNTQNDETQNDNTQSDGTANLKSGGPQPNGDGKNNASKDPLCSECKMVRPDPTEKELVMYLHALCYKGPDFEYSTQLPDWAKEDWTEDN